LEAEQFPLGGKNSALIYWLEVHVAKSHSTVGLNLMRCSKKLSTLAGKGEKGKK
jgi:hypothetical protein